jgi:hypothetical protein
MVVLAAVAIFFVEGGSADIGDAIGGEVFLAIVMVPILISRRRRFKALQRRRQEPRQ